MSASSGSAGGRSPRRPMSTVSSSTSTVTPYRGSAADLIRAALHGEEDGAVPVLYFTLECTNHSRIRHHYPPTPHPSCACADVHVPALMTSSRALQGGGPATALSHSRNSVRSFGDSRDFHSAASSRSGPSSSLPTPQSSASSSGGRRSLPAPHPAHINIATEGTS